VRHDRGEVFGTKAHCLLDVGGGSQNLTQIDMRLRGKKKHTRWRRNAKKKKKKKKRTRYWWSIINRTWCPCPSACSFATKVSHCCLFLSLLK